MEGLELMHGVEKRENISTTTDVEGQSVASPTQVSSVTSVTPFA